MKNFVTTHWLEKHIEDTNLIIVDCRGDLLDENYGRMVYEKGHLKGAVNYYWKDNLNEDNTIKDISYLKERFKNSFGKKEIIVYCGSGIDAAFNFLTLDEIGVKAKLYVGSWSDWITYKENI